MVRLIMQYHSVRKKSEFHACVHTRRHVYNDCFASIALWCVDSSSSAPEKNITCIHFQLVPKLQPEMKKINCITVLEHIPPDY